MAELSDVTESLQKQTAATLKISVETLKQRQAQKKANDESRTKLEELKESIEAAGGVAEESSKYNKLLYEQEKAENDLRKKSADTSAEEKEKRLEARALAAKTGNLLKKIASGIGGLAKASLQTAKKVGLGIFGFLKKALLGAALVGLLLFLNDENWEKIKKLAADGVIWLKDKAVPFFNRFIEWTKSPTWSNFLTIFDETKELEKDIKKIADSIKTFMADKTLTSFGKIFGLTAEETQNLANKVKKYSLIAGGVALALPVMLGALMAVGGLVAWAGWKTIATRLLGGGAAAGLGGATGFKKGAFFKKLLKFGAIFSLVLGAVDGVGAGVDEFKKSGDMQKSVVEGLSQMVESISWGLISEEATKTFLERILTAVESRKLKLGQEADYGASTPFINTDIAERIDFMKYAESFTGRLVKNPLLEPAGQFDLGYKDTSIDAKTFLDAAKKTANKNNKDLMSYIKRITPKNLFVLGTPANDPRLDTTGAGARLGAQTKNEGGSIVDKSFGMYPHPLPEEINKMFPKTIKETKNEIVKALVHANAGFATEMPKVIGLEDDMFKGQFLSPSTKIKMMGHKLQLEGADISEVKAKKLSVHEVFGATGKNEQIIAAMSLAMERKSISAGAPDIHIEAPSVTSATSSSYNNQYVTRPLHHPNAVLGLINAAN